VNDDLFNYTFTVFMVYPINLILSYSSTAYILSFLFCVLCLVCSRRSG